MCGVPLDLVARSSGSTDRRPRDALHLLMEPGMFEGEGDAGLEAADPAVGLGSVGAVSTWSQGRSLDAEITTLA
jgi:hypothetical protein